MLAAGATVLRRATKIGSPGCLLIPWGRTGDPWSITCHPGRHERPSPAALLRRLLLRRRSLAWADPLQQPHLAPPSIPWAKALALEHPLPPPHRATPSHLVAKAQAMALQDPLQPHPLATQAASPCILDVEALALEESLPPPPPSNLAPPSNLMAKAKAMALQDPLRPPPLAGRTTPGPTGTHRAA